VGVAGGGDYEEALEVCQQSDDRRELDVFDSVLFDAEVQAEAAGVARRTLEPSLVSMVNTFIATRRSEHVDASGRVPNKPGRCGNLISPEGALRHAFLVTASGKSNGITFGKISKAGTVLNLKGAVFGALRDVQDQGWKQAASQVTAGTVFVVCKKWDETPLKMSFGKALMKTLLSWGLKRLERRINKIPRYKAEYLEKELKVNGAGVTQVFIQHLYVCLSEGDKPASEFDFVVPPVLLERNTAHCMMKALDVGFDGLSIRQLQHLAHRVRLLGIVLAKDLRYMVDANT